MTPNYFAPWRLALASVVSLVCQGVGSHYQLDFVARLGSSSLVTILALFASEAVAARMRARRATLAKSTIARFAELATAAEETRLRLLEDPSEEALRAALVSAYDEASYRTPEHK